MTKFYLTILLVLTNICLPEFGMSQSTEVVYLSGKGSDDPIEWDFYCTDGRKSGVWSTIPVPSCWELMGFGKYNYGHDPESERGREKGLYKKEFNVPVEWKGKEIRMVFEGVMTDAEVKINGRLAGSVHQGAFYQFNYDISKLVKYDQSNLLEVEVSKESADKSINQAERQADYWIFGGIFRPVYLEIKPKENIQHVAVDARANGDLIANVLLGSIRSATHLELVLFDLNGNLVDGPLNVTLEKNSDSVHINEKFKNVKSWNPEFPYLYELEFRLLNQDNILHAVKQRIGFRTVEVKDMDGIFVNGRKIRFRGVCRHSFWPESGRTTNKSLSIQDVQLMKDMNMNAVRMSHYPPDSHFLDICDSLGLFVLDELAGWQSAYDTGIGEKLVREMVLRDVNHPSVILWDNGNEGGWNRDLDDDFALFDPQKRTVIHPREKYGKTDTKHYIDYNYGNNDFFNGKSIFFPTEFLHGLYDGGLGAGLEDYWNLMKSKPRSSGGFLWVFADESVNRTDKDGFLDSDGNHAPDGILGPHREKEGSFFAIKDIWAPVEFEDKIITPDFNGELVIENQFHYTNLQQCFFFYEFANFVGYSEPGTGYKTLKFGQIKSPVIEPGGKGIIRIDLPDNWQQADVLYIQVIDPHNREIYTWDWAIQSPFINVNKYITKEKGGSPFLNETENSVEMTASNIKISINKSSGLIEEVVSGEIILPLSNGPKLCEGDLELVESNTYKEIDNVVYLAKFKGNLKEIKWTMYGDGMVQLNYIYVPNNYQPYYGISFDFPEEVINGVKWLGKGPYRVWKNRMRGNKLNVWEKGYNNTITGESYDYPEFKGYHANMYWATLKNNVKDFTVLTGTEDLFLRLFTPAIPTGDELSAKTKFPAGDISFLQGISPIGTKFKEANQLGPQSQLNQYERNWTDNTLEIELFFDFR